METRQLLLTGGMVLLAIGCGSPASPQKPVASTPPAATTELPANTSLNLTEKEDTSVAAAPDAEMSSGEIAQEPDTPFQLEEGYTPLSFSDFEAFAAESGTWEGTPDGLKCTGKPPGYLYSKQAYQNFTWRLEYRFPRPATLKDETKFNGNTGFLVYITGEHKVWPVCLEVQGKFAQMAAIKENGGAQPVTATDDDAARQMARKPVGQWNALEIVSTNGALSVSLNGTPISKCEPDFLSEGLIGIQAEKHPFEVRRMRIRRD